jgi:hypothetical protein
MVRLRERWKRTRRADCEAGARGWSGQRDAPEGRGSPKKKSIIRPKILNKSLSLLVKVLYVSTTKKSYLIIDSIFYSWVLGFS